MKKAKIFKNGQSQAVRLPKEFQFKGKEVFAQKVGNGVLLLPADSPWEIFRQSLNKFTDDFMSEREQPNYDERDDL
jgi:antitoxin VapB